MKQALLFIFAVLAISTAVAQEVRLKNGKVIVNQQERFGFERRLFNDEFVVRTLDEGKELFSIIRNEQCAESFDDDFVVIAFPEPQVSMMSFRLSEVTFKQIVSMLLRDQVITRDGNGIDEEKLRIFFNKYNEAPVVGLMDQY